MRSEQRPGKRLRSVWISFRFPHRVLNGSTACLRVSKGRLFRIPEGRRCFLRKLFLLKLMDCKQETYNLCEASSATVSS